MCVWPVTTERTFQNMYVCVCVCVCVCLRCDNKHSADVSDYEEVAFLFLYSILVALGTFMLEKLCIRPW